MTSEEIKTAEQKYSAVMAQIEMLIFDVRGFVPKDLQEQKEILEEQLKAKR